MKLFEIKRIVVIWLKGWGISFIENGVLVNYFFDGIFREWI